LCTPCITLDDIADLAYVEGWRATQSFADEFLIYMTAAHLTGAAYQHALSDSCTLMATRVQLHLAKWMPDINSRQRTMNTEERPISLFRHHGARGDKWRTSRLRPLRNHTDGRTGRRDRNTTDGDERLASDAFGLLGARLVFVVSQHKTVLIDHLVHLVSTTSLASDRPAAFP
jgi:hypothetical protein